MHVLFIYVFFFFQAEDGIRDGTVTGVQTYALPISTPGYRAAGGASETGTAAWPGGDGEFLAGGGDGEFPAGGGVANPGRRGGGVVRTAYQEPAPPTAAERTTMSTAIGSVIGPRFGAGRCRSPGAGEAGMTAIARRGQARLMAGPLSSPSIRTEGCEPGSDTHAFGRPLCPWISHSICCSIR